MAITPVYSVVGSDNFQRSNGPLGSNWTVFSGRDADTPGDATLQLLNNAYAPDNTVLGDSSAIWHQTCSLNDQWAQAQISAIATPPGDSYCGVAVRLSPDGLNGYWFFAGINTFNNANDNRVYTYELWKYVNGSGQSISPAGPQIIFTSVPDSPGDIFQLRVIGNTLYVSKNGTILFSQTDTSLPTGSGIGLWTWSAHLSGSDQTTFSNGGIVTNSTAPGNSGTQWTNWQGGTIVPQIGGGVVGSSASDNFTRANGPIGPNWTMEVGTFNISSNTAVGGTSGENAGYWNATSFTPDQSSSIVLNTGIAGATVRAQAGFESFYLLHTDLPGSPFASIYAAVNGTFNLLASSVLTGVTTGSTITLQVVGSLLTPFLNGVAGTPVTDTTYTNGQPGMRIFNPGGVVTSWAGVSLDATGGGSGITTGQGTGWMYGLNNQLVRQV